MLRRHGQLGHGVSQLRRPHPQPTRRHTRAAHAAALGRVHARERQQTIGHHEDRFGHPVTDREIGDGPGRTIAHREVIENGRPSLLARGRGRLGDITDERHRAGRAAAPDHPQRDRRMVLGLVDDHVAVGERRTVEHRVRLVDQQLVGARSTRRRFPLGPGSSRSTSCAGFCVGHALLIAAFSGAALRQASSRAGTRQQLTLGERPHPLATLVQRARPRRRRLPASRRTGRGRSRAVRAPIGTTNVVVGRADRCERQRRAVRRGAPRRLSTERVRRRHDR